jgi:ABC-type multidrug transport system permease subunit
MIADTIRLAWGLAAKDLRLYFRDKVGMALGFLLPITLIAVFGAVFGSFGGDGGGLPRQTIRVADEDGTDASRKLIELLRGSKLAEVVVDDDGKPFTRAALSDRIKKGRAALGLVIKPGFGATLESEGRTSLELLRDPAKEMEYRIASQALLPAIMETTGGRQARAMPLNIVRAFVGEEAFSAGDKAELEKKSSELYDAMSKWTNAAGSRPSSRASGAADRDPEASFDFMGSILGIEDTLVTPDEQSAGQRQRMGMLAQSVAGTAVMMLLFGLAACGSTILQERDGGTLRRLLITPAPRGAILAGKFMFTFAIGMIQLVVMFAFGGIVFRLPVLRHAGGLLLVGAATCAACTGFGIFIATVGRTQKQIEGISTLVILLMSSLGGSWWPLFITPKWMQVAGHFTLNAWAMDGFLGVLAYRLPISEILLPLGVLFGVAAVFAALSVVFFDRRFASAERG